MDSSQLRGPQQGGGDAGGQETKREEAAEVHPLRHTSMLLVAEVAQLAGNTAQYLLSGLEVWLWREPCHMCAMALLHSRVARLVFCVSSRDGALVTTDRLHTRQNINHRYQVFQACSTSSSVSPPFPFCE